MLLPVLQSRQSQDMLVNTEAGGIFLKKESHLVSLLLKF